MAIDIALKPYQGSKKFEWRKENVGVEVSVASRWFDYKTVNLDDNLVTRLTSCSRVTKVKTS